MNEAEVDSLADTSILVGLARGVSQTAASVRGRRFAICFITVGELQLGYLKTDSPAAATERLKKLIPDERVSHSTEATPFIYARIRHDLERRGKPIPQNDIWIAAVAIENNLPLLARD